MDGGLSRGSRGPLYAFRPLNAEQQRAAKLVRDCDLVFLTGPAGTAKTHVALGVALELLQEQRCKGLVLCRPLVEAGEKTGFLPGDEHQKMRPWLEPFGDVLEGLSHQGREQFFESVEAVPLARMRGRTFRRRVVILDEAQNATPGQLRLFLTRLGPGGKLIVTGDTGQCDLPQASTLEAFARALDGADVGGEGGVRHRAGWAHLVKVVRHPLVAEVVRRTAKIGRRRPRASGPEA
jgi:phosphate starvation-inducible PhoH-like protein